MLQNGNVFVLGGEYSGSGGGQNFTNTGEMYNSATNSWSSITNFPNSRFGDDPSTLLPNGNILTGYISGPQTYIYNVSSNSWTSTGTKNNGDQSDEEGWVKLPDNSILSYDVFYNTGHTPGLAQRYVPGSGTWVNTGSVPVALSSSAAGYELGPNALLPNGKVLQVGGNSNTALYDPELRHMEHGPGHSRRLRIGRCAGRPAAQRAFPLHRGQAVVSTPRPTSLTTTIRRTRSQT